MGATTALLLKAGCRHSSDHRTQPGCAVPAHSLSLPSLPIPLLQITHRSLAVIKRTDLLNVISVYSSRSDRWLKIYADVWYTKSRFIIKAVYVHVSTPV